MRMNRLVDAVRNLIRDGVPIDSDESYDDMGCCYYCGGEYGMEADGYARVQHRPDCEWAELRDALAAYDARGDYD
jgi:hypothetical protein